MRGMETGSVDTVITDPPYPDYYEEEYQYFDGILEPLRHIHCKQFIFWSAKSIFPLDYKVRHEWRKFRGFANFELIYERNSISNKKVYKYQKINNKIDAQMNRDILTKHPSQKPIRLLKDIIVNNTVPGDTIFDPFMGSGTTGVAAVQLGRNFIGCEIDPDYFAIAKKRIAEAQLQPALFQVDAPKVKQAKLLDD
jgi:DNA modification methylase